MGNFDEAIRPMTVKSALFHIQNESGAPIAGALLDAGVWKARGIVNGDCVTF
jgi:hypothetical protein